MNENVIDLYSHCGLCIDELSKLDYFTSPMEYADVSVGLTADKQRVQLWCNRHNKNIYIFNLETVLDHSCTSCDCN